MRYFQRTPIAYRVILITALVLATLFLFQAYMHHYAYAGIKEMAPFNWVREAPVPYLNFLFWALLCPLVYSILQRWPLTARPQWKGFAVHLLAALLVGAVHEVATSSIYYTILYQTGDFKWNEAYRAYALQVLRPGILQRFMEYWVLLVVLMAADYANGIREKHTQLLKLKSELHISQLNALKKQLQPHFLFNTLNTVSALMDEDVNGARKVLSRLGGLLRVTLDKERSDKVRLAEEVDHIGNYLGIESVRFRDRLNVVYDVPAELYSALVPSMVLQPLVENSIKHGLDAHAGRVDITVRAERCNGSLVLCVTDNGRGCTDINAARTDGGIGLRNVRERLKLLYGEEGRMDLAPPPGPGFRVTLSFPYETPSHENPSSDHRGR